MRCARDVPYCCCSISWWSGYCEQPCRKWKELQCGMQRGGSSKAARVCGRHWALCTVHGIGPKGLDSVACSSRLNRQHVQNSCQQDQRRPPPTRPAETPAGIETVEGHLFMVVPAAAKNIACTACRSLLGNRIRCRSTCEKYPTPQHPTPQHPTPQHLNHI